MRRPQSSEVPQHNAAISSVFARPASPTARTRQLALPALLVVIAGGLLRLALAWRNLDALDTYFFPDDTYLSLGIARNLALGFGSTFDRQIATNGYQPLYVWLVAPIYWLFPNDLTLPIHLAVTLLAIAGTLAGWLVYLIVRRLATPWHATIACAIWMFDPVAVTHALNGLETGLAVLGIAATTGWYLARVRARDDVPTRDVLVLGLLTGLTILTRVDQCVLLAAIGLDWLLDRRDRRALLQLALASLVVLAVALPWLALSWSVGAGPLPESGPAVRFNALAQAGGQPKWYLAALLLELSVLFTAPRSTGVLLCAGIIALLLLPSRRGQLLHAAGRRLRPLRFAAFYCAALSLAYWLYIPAYWFFDRYLHPVALFALIAGAAVLPDPRSLLPRARRLAGAAVLVFIVIEAGLTARFLAIQPAPDGYLTIARWVGANFGGQTVGMFQSGAAGYWADGVTVVNLDGVIDRTVLAARRDGRLGDELRRRHIQWVIDWEMTAGLPGDGDLRLGPPREIPGIQTWGSTWYLFKVE
jgi:hypothetical protein